MTKSLGKKLREFSATLSQIVFRYRVIRSWSLLHERQKNEKDSVQKRRIQISLYTSMSIVLTDMLFGFFAALVLTYHPHFLYSPIQRAYLYLNNGILQTVVSWLMGSPAGFQMNRNLVIFMGTISLTVVSYWDALILLLMTSGYIDVDLIISIVFSIASFFGISNLFSVLIDFASFAFFHIFFVYVGVTRLWNLTVRVIYSYTNFFQGKKFNILKNRLDGRHEFDIEQLILGTIFLSLVIFMLPTIFVFYISFLLLWASVLLLQLVLRAGVSIFSFFPLYLYLNSSSIATSRGMELVSGKYRMKSYTLRPAVVLTEFVRTVMSSIPIHEPIANTLGSMVRGTTLVFPKYAQHEQAEKVDSLDYGPHYGALIRKYH